MYITYTVYKHMLQYLFNCKCKLRSNKLVEFLSRLNDSVLRSRHKYIFLSDHML